MRRLACTLAILVVACPFARSQAPAPPRRAPEVAVTRLDIDLELDAERGVLQETVSITLTGEQIGSFVFHIHEGLSVERSKANAGAIDHRKAGSRLLVDIDPPLSGSRTLTFVVSGRPGGTGGTRIGPEWAVLNPADHWYPTLPHTWAESRVRVRAPEGWTVVAPGESPGVAADGTWEWRASRPVRGVVVAASPGFAVKRGTLVATPLRVASADETLGLERLTDALGDPMAWFSGALAPYPFDGLNLVFIDGFEGRASGGGMVVVPGSFPLAGRPEGADLLAGVWFGDVLAGDGRWVESFAAWEAVVYCRDRALPLPPEIDKLRREYFNVVDDVPLALADSKTPEAVVRGKGSAAPDMVRLVAGDRAIYGGVPDLFEPLGRPPLSLAEVRAVFERRTGHKLEHAFSEWFERTGVPEFEAVLRTQPSSTGGFRTDLTLIQKRELYTLPVEVVFHGAGETHREILDVSDETTAVFYVLPFRAARIEVDPLDRIYRRETRQP